MPHARRETADRFEVVVENVRVRREHRLDGLIVLVEIRHEDFDHNAGVQCAHRFNRLAEMFGATVLQIIARHRRDDDVLEPHPSRSLGHPVRLIRLERERLGRGHRAKSAGARAAVARDHERGRAFAPAFPMVRTLRALADGVEFEFVEQRARSAKGVGRG